MSAVAVSWLVFKQLHGTGLTLGIVNGAQFLPWMTLAGYGGAIADRFDKRRLLLTTQTINVLLSTLLAVLVAASAARIWMVGCFALLLGCVGAVDSPARHAFASDLVGDRRLTSAVSLNEVAINLARVVGPTVSALLLSIAGMATAFAVNAACFGIAIGCLVRVPQISRSELSHRQQSPALTSVFAMVWGDPVVRCLVCLAAASAMIFNFSVAIPVFATSAMRSGVSGYSMLVAAFGAGALGGAWCAARRATPTGKTVVDLALASAFAIVVLSTMPTMTLALAAMVLAGFTSIWMITAASSLAQLRVRSGSRGRIMGVWTMALPGSLVVSAPLVGWCVDAAGARVGVAMGGGAVGAVALVARRTLAGTGPSSQKLERGPLQPIAGK